MLFGSPLPARTMRARLLAIAGVFVFGSTVPLAAVTPAMAAANDSTPIDWQACPQYSDAVLNALGISNDKISQFRSLWARTECGTASVPLDYGNPDGRRITIALTRLAATDHAHRLGSLAMNPGGPGGSGYLLPIQIVMENTANAQLNDHYDLIGFDPRGVGYSTKVDCAGASAGTPRPPGPDTEQWAKTYYDNHMKINIACAAQDPGFLTALTTDNVARDLNQIRVALHEHEISYLGTSWGTALGAHYRSLYPDTVRRMWLDSVMGPDFRLDAYTETNVKAYAADFSRMADWIAQRDRTYGLGSSGEQVKAAVLRLQQAYDAKPSTFTDLTYAIDGTSIARIAIEPSLLWPVAAQAFSELRNASGPTAPPAVKQIFARHTSPPPPGTPEVGNPTMNLAVVCNEDAGRRDFDSAWAAYQQRLIRYPVVGESGNSAIGQMRCQGWPLPLRPWRLHPSEGSLQLSAHRYETVTPSAWTTQMQSTIGGTVFTVNDDIHGSATVAPECAAHVVAYFDTGQPDTGQCPGMPEPSIPATASPQSSSTLQLISTAGTWPSQDW